MPHFLSLCYECLKLDRNVNFLYKIIFWENFPVYDVFSRYTCRRQRCRAVFVFNTKTFACCFASITVLTFVYEKSVPVFTRTQNVHMYIN